MCVSVCVCVCMHRSLWRWRGRGWERKRGRGRGWERKREREGRGGWMRLLWKEEIRPVSDIFDTTSNHLSPSTVPVDHHPSPSLPQGSWPADGQSSKWPRAAADGALHSAYTKLRPHKIISWCATVKLLTWVTYLCAHVSLCPRPFMPNKVVFCTHVSLCPRLYMPKRMPVVFYPRVSGRHPLCQ